MYLINIDERRLEFAVDPQQRKYVILSHRWEDREPLQQDFLNNPDAILSSVKIKGLCDRAKELGYNYVWVDTICIDRRSSSELQEAINSMFNWYQCADYCLAYLSDVSEATNHLAFRRSKWFTRGWTLQELIAPSCVIFYDSKWKIIGYKGAELSSLRECYKGCHYEDCTSVVSEVTDIPSDLLLNPESLDEYSIAQKMKWAAGRETSREEDLAYCLLGLFGVNLPLLYGEGDNAFSRLHGEILRQSNDYSSLAYGFYTIQKRLDNPIDVKKCTSLNALSYSGCEHVVSQQISNPEMRHFTMTNNGIHIELPIIEVPELPDMIFVPLNCISHPIRQHSSDSTRDSVVVLPLFRSRKYNVGRQKMTSIRVVGTPLTGIPLNLILDTPMTLRELYIKDESAAKGLDFRSDSVQPNSFSFKGGRPVTLLEVYPPPLGSDDGTLSVAGGKTLFHVGLERASPTLLLFFESTGYDEFRFHAASMLSEETCLEFLMNPRRDWDCKTTIVSTNSSRGSAAREKRAELVLNGSTPTTVVLIRLTVLGSQCRVVFSISKKV